MQRFLDWLRPCKSPLWDWRYPNRGDWLLSCNEGNFPNFCVKPGFFYVAIWLGRPFRFHWKAHWFNNQYDMKIKIRDLEQEVSLLRIRLHYSKPTVDLLLAQDEEEGDVLWHELTTPKGTLFIESVNDDNCLFG